MKLKSNSAVACRLALVFSIVAAVTVITEKLLKLSAQQDKCVNTAPRARRGSQVMTITEMELTFSLNDTVTSNCIAAENVTSSR